MPRVNPFVVRLHICPELHQTWSDLKQMSLSETNERQIWQKNE